jgi:SET domain-containing protein
MPDSKPFFTVKNSKIHGRGIFALRKIPAETCLIEYEGQRISWKEADRRHPANPDDPFHTFYFSLESGKVIDGNVNGNDARWFNHCCDPNCEAREEDGRVFVYALRDIKRGEELNYDYGLILDERHTPKVKAQYRCLCGAANCRGTMLAPKR